MLTNKKHFTKLYYIFIFLKLPLLSFAEIPQQQTIDSLTLNTSNDIHHNINETISFLEENLKTKKEKADTTKVIQTRLMLMEKYANSGKYGKSYDQAWDLLKLTEDFEISLDTKLAVHYRLTALYILFEQYGQAHHFLQELLSLINQSNLNRYTKNQWLSKAYGIGSWLASSSEKDYKKAEEFLLKSLDIVNNSSFSHFTRLQLAKTYLLQHRNSEAYFILESLEALHKEKYDPIHHLLYHYLGQYYESAQNYERAIDYYNKSLKVINHSQKNYDVKIEALNRLSFCYSKVEEFKLALDHLHKALAVEKLVFGSRSDQHKEMFQVRGQFEERLVEQDYKIEKQKVKLLKRENRILFLQMLLLLILIGFIFYFLRRNHKAKTNKLQLEQKKIVERNRMNSSKQKKDIESKNKELVSSAMELLERDEILKDIECYFSQSTHSQDSFEKMKETFQHQKKNKSNRWKQFQHHFSTSNQSFYRALTRQHPSLTSAELKLCAYIKLGFSSKEIASILGIGVDGINTSRSRIRKKLNLPREENLYSQLTHMDEGLE